ncbi:MAG: hypothetical protein P8M30_03545 [Planctomycetaceae bacterium]|nr:hypothetical protein [Planctomycetaceae bacterium]
MKIKEMYLAVTMLAVVIGMNIAAYAAEHGTITLQSAGPISFTPEGVLLVGDPKTATVYAIETGDTSGSASDTNINVKDLTGAIKAALKVNSADITDLAANPQSGNVYLSVTTNAPEAGPTLIKVSGEGTISEFSTVNVKYTKAVLGDAPEDKLVAGRRGKQNLRLQSITDLAYMDGAVLVSGLSKADAPSSIRLLSYPLSEFDPGTSLEIYHGAHGKYEDNRAMNTFVPFNINGEATVLGAYTCTPLVKFPVKDLLPGKKTRGTTVAELGNRNRPLDMVVYQQDGKEFLLMANSARGVMKVSTEDIGRDEGITEPVRGGGLAGQDYVSIKQWEGVNQLDKLNNTHAVIVTKVDGKTALRTVPLP